MSGGRESAALDVATVDAEEPPLEPRRHRAVSELRINDSTSSTLPPPLATAGLTDEARASLWGIVDFFFFSAPPEEAGREAGQWAAAAHERPAIARLWEAPPISGDPARLPEDVATLLEGWFSLVEPADVYAFLEAAHDSLDPEPQRRFAAACNAALERGSSSHRFVSGRLVPFASKADVATVEAALGACGSANVAAGAALADALARLANKPEADLRGAVQEAVRAVELAAFTLTGERYLTLEDTLADLRARGIVDERAESTHRGLFAYAAAGTRAATTDAARRVIVMCAAMVGHLAALAR